MGAGIMPALMNVQGARLGAIGRRGSVRRKNGLFLDKTVEVPIRLLPAAWDAASGSSVANGTKGISAGRT